MKFLPYLLFTFGLLTFVSCDDTEKNNESDQPEVAFTFHQNLASPINRLVPINIFASQKIKTVEVYFNDSLIESFTRTEDTTTIELNTSMFGVGAYAFNLKAFDKKNNEYIDNRLIKILSDVQPEILKTNIIREYPHDRTSFTQGLEFYKGNLYEGTGDPGNLGNTIVAQVDLETGKQINSMGLQVGFFGEGITILNDVLYQLTWQNQKCYTYDVNDKLQLLGEFNYSGEGWGLANDGHSLIMSNGSERIVFRNPETFEIERTIEVYNQNGAISNLNELEYHNGILYANVWTTNYIIGIDPITGKVLKQIDATSLFIKGRGQNGEVLNGIAVNDDKFYLTGKNWTSLFEVTFVSP